MGHAVTLPPPTAETDEPAAAETPGGATAVAAPGPPAVLTSPDGFLPVGTVVAGRYELRGEIARGGMGVVYAAWDRVLDREVALKTVGPTAAADPTNAARFATEVRVTARLQHPGIPPVQDAGTLPDGRPFLAMKRVEGDTLARHIAARHDPADDRRRWLGVFERVCETVAYAHSRAVIHRDLKPSNVMLGSFGEVLVMDWGLAKEIDGAQPEAVGRAWVEDVADAPRPAARDGRTVAGLALGTPGYMPPEQATGNVAAMDARSDVFALGAVLTEVLTGRPAAAVSDTAFDPELVQLVHRCRDPDPAGRPADAAGVLAGLRAWEAAVRSRDERRRAEEEEWKAAVLEEERAGEMAFTVNQTRRQESYRRRFTTFELITWVVTIPVVSVFLILVATEGWPRLPSSWRSANGFRVMLLLALILVGLLQYLASRYRPR